MKLCTQVQLLPDTQAFLIAIHRWKQLILSTHSTESKRLMASPLFLYLYFFKFERAVKSFLCLSANWDVWGDGKLVDQWSEMSYWEGKRQRETEKASDKQSCCETVRSCQAGSCPHNVTHLPPQTGCTQELPTTTTPAFSLSRTYSNKDSRALLTCHCCFEISRSSARCCWKERKEKKGGEKKEMLSLLCGHYCGRSDSMPSQETPWLCYCHRYGHSKSLQPSEINTSWPAACSLSLDADSRLIQGDRTCDLSQPSLGVLTGLGH